MFYSAKEIIQKVKTARNFKEIPADFWICGIRKTDDKPDKFDDVFYLMKGDKIIIETTGTTHPGKAVLMGGFKKYNKKGAAVVVSNSWYNKVWKKGYHKRVYKALVQIGAKIDIYRDGNADDKIDASGKIYSGFFGINFHLSGKNPLKNLIKKIIGFWSAGCQVCNVYADYRKIIKIIWQSDQEFVSYVIVDEFSI
jgi:hypothetical protein